ncbi:hypothetical protein ACC738_38965, partial [Rhizobium ruizarguesonis]
LARLSKQTTGIASLSLSSAERREPAQNAPEIAAKSVELLLANIESEDDGTTPVTNRVILEETLVMRDSA